MTSLCPFHRTVILYLDYDVINFDDVNPRAIVMALCPCVPCSERSFPATLWKADLLN